MNRYARNTYKLSPDFLTPSFFEMKQFSGKGEVLWIKSFSMKCIHGILLCSFHSVLISISRTKIFHFSECSQKWNLSRKIRNIVNWLIQKNIDFLKNRVSVFMSILMSSFMFPAYLFKMKYYCEKRIIMYLYLLHKEDGWNIFSLYVYKNHIFMLPVIDPF